ncbi:cadherin-like domain-containing protein [Pseudofulvimonas gallinarii]|uniref:Tandem-95 repeat protein n=1 Tax=Pseudofulvimonas gallinarii TaxID=634155 RepID=A0A4R3LIJ3_9GAMM|nr:cadherin-like domain-containing protein [Pseudofulvimonas gallinarii]TCT00030.1 hypothetical protein EDC25_10417 [Pseudofulvimonas gallinarii]THD13509.1 hypothetical protein B1808_07095 [Pseudofulvimonas gallinarii]
MRRLFVACIAMATTIAAAAPPWSTDDDRTPKVTDPSVPITYVGGDGSISIGFNAEGETEGQLMGVFGRNDEHAVVGQLWWDRSGAGGVQGDYNWLWGATADEVREDPSKAAVARLSFAIVQNGDHNRKATLGFGIERPNYAVDAYLSRGFGGGRSAGSRFNDIARPVTGSDEIGAYTEMEITTIETLLATKAYDTEVGVQFSHVFDPLGMRVYGGAGLQDGDGAARAAIYSIGLDSPLGRRGWAMTARAEHQRREGDFEDEHSDTRLSFFLRYQFGRNGVFVPSTGQASPAWVQRAFGRPSNAAPRTVDSYVTSAGTRVSVSQGPREYSNYFPVAQPDSATTRRGTAVAIAVLANDGDPDGDPLVLTGVSQPANGNAAIQGMQVVYTPDPDFIGVDTFTYTVADPDGGTGGATVTVTVEEQPDPNRAPVARDDQVVAQADTAVSIDVLANDEDPDNDRLVLVEAGPAANGTVVASGDRVIYTPLPGFVGTDSFAYTISDGRGGTATATVVVTVTPAPNRPPVASSDGANTTVNTPVSIDVLANDFDPDGDPLVIFATSAPSSGTAVVAGNVVVYTPAAGFTGNDAFSYTVGDLRGGIDTGFVSVRVDAAANTPPVAVNDTTTTTSGTAISIPVLANDSDPDGDPLTIIAVGTPALGTASIAGANILYTPGAGLVGADSFSYTIDDGNGGQASATVTVNVLPPVNLPPVAVNDTRTILLGAPTSIDVLANDSDPDGDPLTIVSVTTPAAGTATISGNMVVYTPAVPFPGTDSFDYTISDGNGGFATATVFLAAAVNNPPVAVNDTRTVPPGVPTAIDVLANDSDPDGDPLTIVSVTTPGVGTASISGNMVIYTAVAGGPAADTFDYTVSDGNGGLATATVSIAISTVNQPPVAANDAATTSESVPVMIPVLDNDSDPDGDPLTLVSVTTPVSGTASIVGNMVEYVPEAGFVGALTFQYTISDGNGGTATATVTVTVTPVNQAPVALDDNVTIDPATSATINVLANDFDPDGDPLTIVAVGPPSSGSAVISGSVIVYTAIAAFPGADEFTYTISDGNGGTATALVRVTGAPPNQPPVANDDVAVTDFGTPAVIQVLNNDFDPDGDPLLIISTTQPANGIVSFNNTTVTYSPNGGFTGVDAFTYTISDGRGGTATATVLVAVN